MSQNQKGSRQGGGWWSHFFWVVLPYFYPMPKRQWGRRKFSELMPTERLRRIVSHYHLLSDEDKKGHEQVCLKFEAACKAAGVPASPAEPDEKLLKMYEGINARDEGDGEDPEAARQRKLTALVHEANLLWTQIQPVEQLETYFPHSLGQLEDVGGASLLAEVKNSGCYKRWESGQPGSPQRAQDVRTLSLIVENLVRKQQQQVTHGEEVRAKLILSVAESAWTSLHFCLVVLLSAYLLGNCWEAAPPAAAKGAESLPSCLSDLMSSYLVLFAWMGCFGVIGAFVSVLGRLQGLGIDNRIGRNLLTLEVSELQLRFAPQMAAVFAGVLGLLFAAGVVAEEGGKLLSSGIFPALAKNDWQLFMCDHGQLARLALWGFVAGFSERLVPDMLDMLSAKVKQNPSRNAPQPAQRPPADPGTGQGKPPPALPQPDDGSSPAAPPKRNPPARG